MKQKSNETSSSRWEIKFELTAPLWILINPELVRRRTQTRAAKSKKRSVVQGFLGWKKKKEFIIREIYECFEPSRLERLGTQPRLLNQIWIPRIFTDRGIRAGGTWIRNYATGGRARHACTIRVRINPSYDVAWKSNGGGPSLTNFLFLFFLFFWPPTPFRLVVLALCKRFSRSFRFVLQGYKIWKSHAIGRTNEIILY